MDEVVEYWVVCTIHTPDHILSQHDNKEAAEKELFRWQDHVYECWQHHQIVEVHDA